MVAMYRPQWKSCKGSVFKCHPGELEASFDCQQIFMLLLPLVDASVTNWYHVQDHRRTSIAVRIKTEKSCAERSPSPVPQ